MPTDPQKQQGSFSRDFFFNLEVIGRESPLCQTLYSLYTGNIMLNYFKNLINLSDVRRIRTVWGVSIIIINGMTVAVCDKFLQSIGGDHGKTTNKESDSELAEI